MNDPHLTPEQLQAEVQALRQRVAELERRPPCGPFLNSQKMEMVGRLAGGVAHEFNNLLTIITGYSNLLLDRLPADDASRGPIREIRKAGDRAAALTQQLLAFGRKQLLAPVELSLNTILDDMSRMLRALLGEGVELTLYLDPSLGRVKADQGQIEQVILNLVVNARDAMPQGGRLVLETRNVYLDEEYARTHAEVAPGYYALLAVSDSGVGIDPETLGHLFEPYYTTKEPGHGLGLPAVYGIVKQSDGHVEVESQPGRGSTFKVFLPLLDQVVPTFEVQSDLAHAPTGTETILLAEDDEGIRRLAKLILDSLGYQVLEAADGRDALARLERHAGPLDLLITDVIMPNLGGRELADRLRGLRPDVRVLFLSGYSDHAISAHGIPGEGCGFLQKPFTPLALARRVREVLDMAR
jgi:two-component system cell cycle sensor histidine kinase/response regulator CckA